MAISLASIKKTTALSAPRVLLMGTAGVGKTTFASQAPAPIFLFTEDGAGALEVDAFPLITSFGEIMEAITTLYSEQHEFSTVVVDSVDHLEPLIWKQVCVDHQVDSIEQLSYGKGYILALDYWRQFLDGINALRNDKGMAIILIGHVQINRFESPEHDSIDRYDLKLHKRANALIQESVDCILFAKHKTLTKTEELGFNQKRTRGVSTGQRVICTTETPAYVAKNRYSLPDELPLSWDAFAAAMTATKPNLTNEAA